MTQERNKSSVRRLYEECINPGKLELLNELISVAHVGPLPALMEARYV